MKLFTRFLLVPIILAVFIYLFYSAYKDVRDRTLNEFNSQQFALAKQASRGIESFFIYYQRELLFLSKLPYISDLNDQGRILLSEFYDNHSDQIEAITIVDSTGILRFTYPLIGIAVGQDISSQKHISTILSTHRAIVSDVFTSVQGYRAIAYHIPIFRGDKYIGSIAILISFDKLSRRFLENIKTGKTGYGSMISEDGIVLFSPDTNQTGKSVREIYDRFPSVLKLIDRSLIESEGTAVCNLAPALNNNKDLTRTLVGFYRIPLNNSFWTIMIFTPENEILGKLTSFRNRLYMLFSLIIILIITFFYLTFKAMTILKEEKKRKAFEEELGESEKRFRTIFELSPVGIILIDEIGTVIEVNSSFCETLKYTREEVLGKNIRLFASPDKEGEIEKNITKILSGKTIRHEVKNLRKDGTTCDIALYETMILLPDGNTGILSVSNDITERKKAHLELIKSKEKAEESDRLKSAFLANMSHELRTPLNAIIGFSGLLAETGGDIEIISNSKIIFDSGMHLLGLVEDIIDISMIETGQIKINYEEIGIISLLNEVKNIIDGEKLKENKTRINIILKTKPDIIEPHIYTDGRKLKQVLINLLKNSLKFTDEGYIEFGFTEIEKSNKKYLKFYVKDTGIGIDKINHETIFDIFRQVEDSHTRRFGGTGIGLSITKKIVMLLGGEIWVESEIGKGSLFYFTIPSFLEKKEIKNIPLNNTNVKEKDYSGKTILVAEDEVTSYEFLKIFLKNLNINVLYAKNGLEAISLCEENNSIDLVLMDLKMPLLNGYEATKKIKIIRHDLPVVAQTAYAMLDEKEEAINSGCDDYLTKPIKIVRLMEILEKYLS